jgi:hypothetical protein
MQKRSTVSWFGMVLPLTLAASAAAAQSTTHRQEPPAAAAAPLAAASVAAPDSAALAPDSANAPESGKKKKGGGLFGKVKGVAKNKVVQSVVKTAACTMVPGGQYVAGAIDAAANKNAATGAAGAATGSSCAAGLGGMGMTPRVPGAQGADLANVQAAQAAAGGAGNAQMMAAMQMQAMTAQLAQLQQMQRMSGAAGAVPGTMPGMPGGGMTGEGMGQPIAVTAEKNKTVIRNIDWLPGTGGVSATGAGPFQQALIQAGTAVLQAGGSYRLDLYMDKQSPDAVAKSLGSQRLASVQTAFLSGPMAGQPNAVPLAGKIKRDGDPRLEIVKIK